MTKEEIEDIAMKASGAVINGYRYGKNGREPIYAIEIETEDGVEYVRFEIPTWLNRFSELLLEEDYFNTQAKISTIVRWLEEHQPDVFRRGMWDALLTATSGKGD